MDIALKWPGSCCWLSYEWTELELILLVSHARIARLPAPTAVAAVTATAASSFDERCDAGETGDSGGGGPMTRDTVLSSSCGVIIGSWNASCGGGHTSSRNNDPVLLPLGRRSLGEDSMVRGGDLPSSHWRMVSASSSSRK